MRVYDKEPLSCNANSDQNVSFLIKSSYMELLFILYKPLVCLLNCNALKNRPK